MASTSYPWHIYNWYLTEISQIFLPWTTIVQPYFQKMQAINLQDFHLLGNIYAFNIHYAFKWWLCLWWFKHNYAITWNPQEDSMSGFDKCDNVEYTDTGVSIK